MSEMLTSSESIAAKAYKNRMVAIVISLGVGILLMAVKFYTYGLTHSSSVLSDALESIINVVAAAFAMGSIMLAAKPADRDHPYGHGKIEYFSAGFEGALIIIASIGIFKTGLDRLLAPQALPNLQKGMLILLFASLVNLAVGTLLIRTGKRTQSLTLIADGKHLLTDVYTTFGVLIGLIFVKIGGWLWLDGAVACLVGLNILYTGAKLMIQSFSGLMDTTDPAIIDEISTLLHSHRKPYWIDIHKLRTKRSGNFLHIDFHLVLPRDFTLERAHIEVRELEYLIRDHFKGNAGALIHTDPCKDPDCAICSEYACEMRTSTQERQKTWTGAEISHRGE
jgi:cation diffusion facilitator family transporter